uniref:AB hydrolase-1 domain-containing protein n=1 Tax=Noccaea caerulescens TaxID=107243 RepID=A0A1J3EN27_NOCCA
MEALRFQLSSASLTSTIPASTLQHSHSRHFLSSVQLGRVGSSPAIGAVSNTASNEICTADELHYVPVPNSDWRAALWRYLPSPKAPKRKHPLLLLSGIATNAFTYDLSPESSFARFMSASGFDTWILELRGAGLSSLSIDTDPENPRTELSNDKQRIVSDLLENLINASESLENVLDGGFKILGVQDRLSKKVEDFKQRLELIPRYSWDFDNYLEEDIPCAMEYVRSQSKPKDGKLLAIGHSMGGILLYAMLSKCGFKGMDSGFASVTTIASTLDYSSSGTLLKYILPVKGPAKALKVPVMPIDTMLAMAHPLMCRPPYPLSWLTTNISAPQMMDPELIEKLVLNSLCTVPVKLILQLATSVGHGGLRDRTGTFCYKDHIGKTNVPILALAGDWDIICPPDAVYDTVKLIPEHLATFKVLGSPGGPHYGHQDMISGRTARREIYPLIIRFLQRHDEC